MRQWLIGSVVVLGLAAGTAAQAQQAGGSGGVEASTGTFNIQVGLKWSPLRYTHPVYGSGVGGVDAGGNVTSAANGGAGLYGWQTTSLDSYIGFFFHPQIGAILALDLGYSSDHLSTTPPQGNTVSGDVSYFQFGFAIGGKFYLTRPTGLRVSPYLYVDFFKYFTSITTSAMIPPDQVGAFAGLHAPLGFDLAFGAEYWFTNSFSLGAEVLGFRFAYVEGDYNDMTNTNHGEHALYFTLYTGITLNYRFLASASVRLEADVETDDSAKRPAKRARPRPRPATEDENAPPPPPTPTPENVD